MGHGMQNNDNVNSAMSEFDQLSMRGTQTQQPAAKVDMSDFTNVTPTANVPRGNATKKKQPDNNMFRPTENLKQDKRFKADKKPSLVNKKEKKKVNPLKIVIPIATVGITLFLCLGVRPINMSIKTIGGANKYYTKAEIATINGDLDDLKSVVSSFSSLATDNSIKGDLSVNLSSLGAERYLNSKFSGVYEGTYEYHFSDSNLFKFDYSKDGVEMGETEIELDAKNNVLTWLPSFTNGALSVDLEKLSDEFEPLGIGLNSSNFKKTLKSFGGFIPDKLVSTMISEKASEELQKIGSSYTSLLTDFNYKSSYIAFPSVDDKSLGITEGYSLKASWTDTKTFIDSIISTAKSDSNLLSWANGIGVSEQAYLDKLNKVSSSVNTMYTSSSPDATCEMCAYTNKDGKIVYRVIKLPVSDSGMCSIYITDTDTKRSVYIDNNGIQSFIDLSYEKGSNDTYKGSLVYTKNGRPVSVTFDNLVLGDTMSGGIVIVDDTYTTNISISAAGTEHVTVDHMQNNQSLFKVDLTYQTYARAEKEQINAKSSTELYSNRSEVKLDNFLKWLENANLDSVIALIQPEYSYTIDEEKLKEHYAKLFLSWGTKAYDYTEKPDLKPFDKEAAIEEAIDHANEQAAILNTAINRFISDVISEGGEVANGVYYGQVTDKDVNMNFANIFDEKNLKMCVANNVDSGYYCIVVKNSKVTYTFWSATESFEDRVKAKDLPTHFASYSEIEEVKGSYPYESGKGE